MQTHTIQQKVRNIAEQRYANYVGYHEHQTMLRRDEITDAAERVRAPLQHTGNFVWTPEGLLNDLGQNLGEITRIGLDHAHRMARTNPDWTVEVRRAEIELQEYHALLELAATGRRGDVLVARWLIPEEVLAGNSSLPGYNRARKKMFNRFAMADGQGGITIGYQSLDRSDYEGVRAMDAALGFELQNDVDTATIAGNRRHLHYAGPIEDLMNSQREVYDASLAATLGGTWFAGREPMPVKEIVAFIMAPEQNDLVEAHMAVVNRVFNVTRDRNERMRLLEPHRYNFAAALDQRARGEEVVDLEQAGNTARDAGENYDGDCPVGESSAEDLGFGGNRKFGPCPHCKTVVEYDICKPECSACGANANHGPLRKIGALAVKTRPKNGRPVHASPEKSRNARPTVQRASTVHTLNGRRVLYDRKLTVGGTIEVILDITTGKEVAST